MSDNEVIRDLKICFDVGACANCGHAETRGGTVLCRTHLMGDALDLINRKDAKIERLEEKVKSLYKEIERIALMTVLSEEKEMTESVNYQSSKTEDGIKPTKIEHSSLCETESFEVKE